MCISLIVAEEGFDRYVELGAEAGHVLLERDIEEELVKEIVAEVLIAR